MGCDLCIPVRFSDSGGAHRTPETGDGFPGPRGRMVFLIREFTLSVVEGLAPTPPSRATRSAVEASRRMPFTDFHGGLKPLLHSSRGLRAFCVPQDPHGAPFLRPRGLCVPALPGNPPPVTCHQPPVAFKSFRMHSYEKCDRNSFGIHSYEFKGLKLPWNDTLTKIPGWGAPLCLAHPSLTLNDEVE